MCVCVLEGVKQEHCLAVSTLKLEHTASSQKDLLPRDPVSHGKLSCDKS